MDKIEEKRKKQREYMRKYNKTPKGAAYNKAHSKAWRNKNKKPHGKRAQRTGEYRQVIINYLIERDGLLCGFCKKSLEGYAFHINHIIPVALGGPHIMSNLNLAHPDCNTKEGSEIKRRMKGIN